MSKGTTFFLVLLTSVAGQALHAQALGTVARDGFFSGMTFNRIMYQDARVKILGFSASSEYRAAPISQTKIIEALIDALRGKKSLAASDIESGATFMACGGVDLPCETGVIKDFSDIVDRFFPSAKEYAISRASILPDGRVRVEWQKEGNAWFVTLITLKENKLADITDIPALVPVRIDG